MSGESLGTESRTATATPGCTALSFTLEGSQTDLGADGGFDAASDLPTLTDMPDLFLMKVDGGGDGPINVDMTTPTDMTTVADMTTVGFPPPPILGAQIDRMGRPGLNIVVTDPFWDTGVAGATLAVHEAKQDAYNAAAPASWSSYAATFSSNLATYDGLDSAGQTADADLTTHACPSGSTVGCCGNQLAYGAPLAPANMPYGTLATLLADDELYVDTRQGTCAQYLGVEISVLGTAVPDCGGRTPMEDVINLTYSALTAYPPLAGSMITDGISADGDGVTANTTTFPFLGTPNN